MTDIPHATPAAATPAPAEERAVALPTLSLLAFLIGVVAAFGAVVFRGMIAFVHNLFFFGRLSGHYNTSLYTHPSPWGPFVILVPVVGGLIVVWVVKTFAPEAKGHGVPEVMFAIFHNNGNVRGIVAVIKSIASAISIGSGASVGREGPIVQIGASFGSTLGRLLGLARWQKIVLLAAGGGAGIAATFNTPLGGVLFAVELLLPEISNRTFLPVVVATATATFIGRIVLGLSPAFAVPDTAELTWSATNNGLQLLGFAVLGALCGVGAWAFVRLLAWCEDVFPRLPGNAYTQNVIGMLILGCLMYGFMLVTGHYHTEGVGYSTVQDILDGTPFSIAVLVALFVGKTVATSVSLGSGASGGVFSPSLFLGAALGGAVGALGHALFPAVGFSADQFAVVGMGAMVGGATGASMTAIVMIFEMTRDYGVVVPLVLAVAIAVSVRRRLVVENIYTVKLRKRGRPIPTIRHTNMYLVQQAGELMNDRFVVLPARMPVADALAHLAQAPGTHIVVAGNGRIMGYVRAGTVGYGERDLGKTLGDVFATDFAVVGEKSVFNDVISRMARRGRSFVVVVHGDGVPRPDSVVGVIDSPEIAKAVVQNHYA
ncbi:MAG TPA: chloride channel protein [Hyphomicrobiales bacterium]|nr:chloride channel protein [Hyphomicrobiales bacterium]